MPELFPTVPLLLASVAVMAAAQMIYATLGFGAGMFAVSLLALMLPDLRGVVVVLLILTLITETWVLAFHWRRARFDLLLWLIPTTGAGLWIGTRLLVVADVGVLKRWLGLVVLAAGAWFLVARTRARQREDAGASHRPQPLAPSAKRLTLRALVSLPVGLAAGVLGALFGTGGPPVIVFFRAYGLDKRSFRATILMYFFTMSALRAATYLQVGLIDTRALHAAAALLPGSLIGVGLGFLIHRRLSEQHFASGVSALLIVLGALLAAGGGS